MNERIGKLRLQACKWASENVPIGEYENASDEKFAELIVGECLKIAKNREDELESAGLLEESNAVGIVAYRISRQFGVKR